MNVTVPAGAEGGRYLRVTELLHNQGVRRHDRGRLVLESAGLTSARLAGDRDTTYDLILEAQGRQVNVTGTAQAAWTGPCRRCLEETGGDLEVRVAEIFSTAPMPGETWPIVDGVIDLEPPLREALLLELPVAPLCRADCEGPEPDRYPTAPLADDQPEAVADPRWAALADLQIDDGPGSDP